MIANIQVRELVKDKGLRYEDIANKIGVSRVWLSKLMSEVNRMNDLISRQAAIDAMNTRLEDIKLTWRGKVKKGEIAMYLDMRVVIETLPSAQPERKKGEWIKKISKKIKDKEYIGYTPYWYCSECGKGYEPAIANTIINYCYNCGAKMEGDVDD